MAKVTNDTMYVGHVYVVTASVGGEKDSFFLPFRAYLEVDLAILYAEAQHRWLLSDDLDPFIGPLLWQRHWSGYWCLPSIGGRKYWVYQTDVHVRKDLTIAQFREMLGWC